MSIDELAEIARLRTKSHLQHASRRPLSADYDLVGVVGEYEFARLFDLDWDYSQKIGGDQGIDFVLPSGITVDVKTFRKPYNLIQEKDKLPADVYVLAGYNDQTHTAEILGWSYKEELMWAPVKDFGAHIPHHTIPRHLLRKNDELNVKGKS
jgi:hypothetical protein